jgi:hypothetical protein
VALTTAATLVLELALTRLFSVVFYYHFAFLAISIALFGLGAGGVLSYLVPQRGPALYRRLGAFSLANAVLTLLVLLWLLGRTGAGVSFSALAGVYLAASLPFLLAGLILALAIAETIEQVERVYFWDLAGAALGCLLLIPVLNISGAPGAVLASAVLSAAAAAVWFGVVHAARRRAAGVALALALVALLVYNKQERVLDLHSAKGAALVDEIFVQWNSFSRISVKRAPGGALTIAIDADSTTRIAPFDADHFTPADRAELASGGPGLVYQLRPAAKTLVLGAGGGWDVARALASGSTDVTAVEINPIIARTIMQGRCSTENHALYNRPEVRLAIEDGRGYVRRSAELYQVLQATQVDTWASSAAGAYALSENNLYTVEAFRDYLGHLTSDGLLSFTRWGFDPPRESLRLAAVARSALASLGQIEPWRNVVVLRENAAQAHGHGATDTVLISRKPFTTADLARLHAVADRGFQWLYVPAILPATDSLNAANLAPAHELENATRQPAAASSNAFRELLTAPDPEPFYAAYRFDVRPVTDDRPFFFYTVQPRDVGGFVRSFNRANEDYQINLAVPALFALLGVSAAATLVTLLLPPLLPGARLPRERGLAPFLLYFVALGAGYVVVEVSLIQRLILLLGHPTRALTFVIFTLLLSSGAGSFASRRLLRRDERRLRWVPLAVAAAVTLLAFALGPLSLWLVSAPTFFRLLAVTALVAPAGFFMGMPLPGGLALLEAWRRDTVRWAWSLNAAASVLGSALAILLAICFGLRATLLAGAACYLVAALLLIATARFRRSPA